MEKIAERIKEIIDKSRNIVVLSGLNTMRETGLNGVRAEHLAYETEEKYGYSNDEIVSSAFYARRSDIFYDYIKNVTINKGSADGCSQGGPSAAAEGEGASYHHAYRL